jgi:hypothetical protein
VFSLANESFVIEEDGKMQAPRPRRVGSAQPTPSRRIRPAAEQRQAKPSLTKQNQAKLLGLAWFYSSESGLFNGLRRKK